MIKYKTIFARIEEVEVIKETDKSVTLANGSRANKQNSYEKYFDTHEEAVAHVISIAQQKVDKSKRELAYYEKELSDLKAKYNIK